jgi:Ca2+/Na+ antiporter
VLNFAQKFAGKLLILALFAGGLSFGTPQWIPLSLCLAMITFVPVRRRILVTVATLIFTFVVPWNTFLHPFYTSSLIIFVIMLGAVCFWLVVQFRNSVLGRHAVFFLLTGYSLFIIFAAYFPNNTPVYLAVWDLAYIFGIYVWFFAYSLQDIRATDRDGLGLQLGTYRPFWGSTHTPFAKGASYLRRIEARDGEQLAVTQLKGFKLLAWSLLISVFSKYFQLFVHGYLAIPTFPEAFVHSVQHKPDAWYMCWASLVTAFFEEVFYISIWGHRFIACCRMAGFNALRNTHRPLSARTVAEFWNSFYFYFKELLADFFFYPVFLNYFKKNKRLRIAVATFAAAGFGNAFYHFIRDLHFISELGLWRAFTAYHVYLFYCTVLAGGIAISQLRKRRPPPAGFFRGHVVPVFCVVLFYCLLHVFDYTERTYPIHEHFRFVAHLINLGY